MIRISKLTVRKFHFYRFDSLINYPLSYSNAYHDQNDLNYNCISYSNASYMNYCQMIKRYYSNGKNSENLISHMVKTQIIKRSQNPNSYDIRSVYSDIDNLLYFELLRQFEHLPRDVNISRSELFQIRFQIERNLYSFSPMRLTKYIEGDIIPSTKYKFKNPDGCYYLLSITPNDYLVYQALAEALISYSVAFKYVSKESYLYNRSNGDEFTILLDEINSWIGLDSIEYYCLNYESLRRMPKDFLGSYLLKMFYQGSRIYSLLHSFIYAPIIDSEVINYNNMIGIPPVYPLCSVLMNLGLNLLDEQYQGLVLDQRHVRYLNQILIPVFGERSDKYFDEALKVVGLGDINYTTDRIKRGFGAIYLKPRGLVRLNKKGNVVLKKNLAYLDDI